MYIECFVYVKFNHLRGCYCMWKATFYRSYLGAAARVVKVEVPVYTYLGKLAHGFNCAQWTGANKCTRHWNSTG